MSFNKLSNQKKYKKTDELAKKVGNKGIHNAFTDLCEFKGSLFCCYREAKNHVSRDGVIRILCLDFLGNAIFDNAISVANTDLRDPKLSVTPDGELLLIAYARLTTSNNRTVSSNNVNWISQNGKSWSAIRYFADQGWWLWRLNWLDGLAYGFAYNRKANAIHLYKGNPRRSFHLHQAKVLSLAQHHLGYPNESDLLFHNKTAYALIRRDADSYSAQLGTSSFPYKRWQWLDLNIYIGGPVMIHLKNHIALVAGRILQNNKLVTGLMSLDLLNGRLTLITVLPSARDNSYPDLVLKNNRLYISYYSSHLDNKSSVYLAELDIDC
ncbi:hypothetical protein RS130_19245 [Paraglaciecola aquimarina]|uniref:Signal peptide prediction n=1 Tax=Paraglaciecola aquimarina TaxID=1235557 RepID=A0ABU3T0D5_9ALTE|nr:hypothetical protein [Paraglaciecola aquimarina]MDU0355732.1 hypothetical protein [Paraglaciecola aquimarina]